jgi:hypothetical protein
MSQKSRLGLIQMQYFSVQRHKPGAPMPRLQARQEEGAQEPKSHGQEHRERLDPRLFGVEEIHGIEERRESGQNL